MSGFHITCTTCQSRLKVKDESAVGLILSCPKCGSMVMVQPPSERAEQPMDATASVGGGRRHDSTSETKVDFSLDGLEEMVSGTAPSSISNPSDGLTPPTRPPDSANGEDAPVALPATAEGLDAIPDNDPAQASEPEPLAPGSQWVSKETRQLKQWLLAGAAMVFGVLAIVTLVIFMLSGERTAHVTKAGEESVQTTAPSVQPADALPLETNPVDATAEPSADGDSTDDSTTTNTGTETPQPLPPIAGASTDPLPPISAPPNSVPPDHDATATDEAKPANPATDSPPAENNAAGTDVLGPPDLALGGGAIDPLSPLPSMDQGIGELLDDKAFAGFEAMIEEAADLAPPAAPDPDEESMYDRFNAEVNPPRRPPGMQIDAPASMQIKIPRLEFKGAPLESFLEILMSLSNVPITVDPTAVIHARIDPDAPVTCQSVDAPLWDALSTTVAPLGLQLLVGERHARLHLQGYDKPIEFSFPADDLAADDAQRKWLVDTLMQVVQPGQWAPQTASTAAWSDDTQLKVRQTRLGMFETLQFLETLRTARKLPLKSKAPPEQYATGSRRARAIPRLSRLTSVNIRDPLAFREVLAALTSQTGMRMLVDWDALETKQWNRRTEATLLTHQETLAKSLRLLLTPMELDYLVLGEDTLMVTTPQATANWRELAIYEVPDLVPEGNDVEQALTDVRTALGVEKFAADSGNSLAFDEQSRSVIARLSPRDQRRLRALINELRSTP